MRKEAIDVTLPSEVYVVYSFTMCINMDQFMVFIFVSSLDDYCSTHIYYHFSETLGV